MEYVPKYLSIEAHNDSVGCEKYHLFMQAVIHGNQLMVRMLLEKGVVSIEEVRGLAENIEIELDNYYTHFQHMVKAMKALLVELEVFDKKNDFKNSALLPA